MLLLSWRAMELCVYCNVPIVRFCATVFTPKNNGDAILLPNNLNIVMMWIK